MTGDLASIGEVAGLTMDGSSFMLRALCTARGSFWFCITSPLRTCTPAKIAEGSLERSEIGLCL